MPLPGSGDGSEGGGLRLVPRTTKGRVALAALLILALAIRIASAVDHRDSVPQLDAADYTSIAMSIANGDGYPPSEAAGGGGAGAIWPPGYPAFLAAVFEVSGEGLLAARLVQALLGTLTVALIGVLAGILFGRLAGIAAVGIAAVYPEFVLTDSAILSETLFVPLTLGAAIAACLYRRSVQGWRWAAVAGGLTGLAILTRQNAFLLLVPLILLMWQSERDTRQRVVGAVLVVAISALVVLPWTIRNAVEFGTFVPVSTQSGIVLAGTYNEQSRTDSEFPGAWRPPNSVPDYAPLFRDETLDEAELDAELRARALDFLADHPVYPLSVGWHNMARLLHLGGDEFEAFQAADRNLTAKEADIGRFSFYVLALMAFGGAITPIARRAPWPIWLIPVSFAAVSLAQGMVRYRVPMDPYFVLLAACLVASILVRTDQARRS